MARPVIGIKNITGGGVKLQLNDLTNGLIADTVTVNSSDYNTYDDMRSSKDLYAAIEADQAFIVIDTVVQDKANSLNWMNGIQPALPSSVDYVEEYTSLITTSAGAWVPRTSVHINKVIVVRIRRTIAGGGALVGARAAGSTFVLTDFINQISAQRINVKTDGTGQFEIFSNATSIDFVIVGAYS